jgi:gamma-glutamylcyclotransferase (GGCT)/AIG2-like uncharacterized protein YtfP
MPETVLLFSYGTLQQREVQLANYGRELAGEPDALVGYRLGQVEIDDPDVVSVSGKAVHTIAFPSADQSDQVRGTVYPLTPEELEASDAYETDAYVRAEVTLESGRRAFVYVAASTDSRATCP